MKIRHRLVPATFSLILVIFSGCGEKDTNDPTIDVKESAAMTLALAKSPETSDFIPLKVVASKSEPDHWLVTVVHQNDKNKRGKFRVEKSGGKVTRLPD